MFRPFRVLAVFGGLSVVALSQGDGTLTVAQRLAKWKRVEMPFRSAGLSARERQMVEKLVEACRALDNAFWRQSDRAGLALYKSARDEQSKRLLGIMGSRWDLIDEDRPFTGKEAMPAGREYYPHDLTRARVDEYL